MARTAPQPSRDCANALSRTRIHGIETNLPFLENILGNGQFLAGRPTTRLLGGLAFSTPSIEVLTPGTMTTVQEWPGRLGFWGCRGAAFWPHGRPRLPAMANRIVGNDEARRHWK